MNGGDAFDDLGPEEKIKFSQAEIATKLAKLNDAIARRMAPTEVADPDGLVRLALANVTTTQLFAVPEVIGRGSVIPLCDETATGVRPASRDLRRSAFGQCQVTVTPDASVPPNEAGWRVGDFGHVRRGIGWRDRYSSSQGRARVLRWAQETGRSP